jgi:hypothetical protein
VSDRYGHIGPRIDSRRASTSAPPPGEAGAAGAATDDAAAAAAAAAHAADAEARRASARATSRAHTARSPSPLSARSTAYQTRGSGYGGGGNVQTASAGFTGDYGARYSWGHHVGGARIWMPGNVDLPAEYGADWAEDAAAAAAGGDGYGSGQLTIEDMAAQAALAARGATSEHYRAYADSMRSLRLRDGGGLTDALGIDLGAADAAVAEAMAAAAAQRAAADAASLRELHLIIMGPAFGIDFAPADAVRQGEREGQQVHEEGEEEPVTRGRTGRRSSAATAGGGWSGIVVNGISRHSPFRHILAPGDWLVGVDGVSVAHIDYEHALQRLLLAAARATEAAPRTLTFLVPPAALAKAKVIMRAELAEAQREETLARHASEWVSVPWDGGGRLLVMMACRPHCCALAYSQQSSSVSLPARPPPLPPPQAPACTASTAAWR